MLFEQITHTYQVFCHLADKGGANQALWWLDPLSGFQHVLLFLEDTEPGRIELTP